MHPHGILGLVGQSKKLHTRYVTENTIWGESQLEFVKCFFNCELIALKDTRKEQNAQLCEIYHGL